jgi:hypothetical protein
MTGLHEVEPHECIVRIPIDEQKQQLMTAASSNATLEGNLIIPKAEVGAVDTVPGINTLRKF